MTRKAIIIISLLTICMFSEADNWKGEWIRAFEQQNSTNNWTAYHKPFHVDKLPKIALAKIACDSKYWMWINGEMAVFEGQLKRGPTPKDTYYDEIDIAPFLKQGANSISILVWYFGKDGFSHNSSGKSALIFDCQNTNFELISDISWKAIIHPAFGQADYPFPNFRLPESNIRYDARRGNFDFTKAELKIMVGKR